MELLHNLGFKPIREDKHNWLYKDVFFIHFTPPANINLFGHTYIARNIEPCTGNKTESILYQGAYAFCTEYFAQGLLKNTGVIEKIKGIKILEPKKICHAQVLTEMGFVEVVHNIWVKNIFLISVKPPLWDTDRGKCLILKKPNVKKLVKNDKPAKVMFKGRYFFEDEKFRSDLFNKIGLTYFLETNKNKQYEFIRDKVNEINTFLDEQLMCF